VVPRRIRFRSQRLGEWNSDGSGISTDLLPLAKAWRVEGEPVEPQNLNLEIIPRGPSASQGAHISRGARKSITRGASQGARHSHRFQEPSKGRATRFASKSISRGAHASEGAHNISRGAPLKGRATRFASKSLPRGAHASEGAHNISRGAPLKGRTFQGARHSLRFQEPFKGARMLLTGRITFQGAHISRGAPLASLPRAFQGACMVLKGRITFQGARLLLKGRIHFA
jgi:hypothetical protein